MNLLINNLINKKGTNVFVVTRGESIDTNTGSVTYSWTSTISARCITNEVGGMVELWDLIGKKQDADLQLLFKPNISINSGDKIIFGDDSEYIVEQVIKSGPINPDFVEVMVSRAK